MRIEIIGVRTVIDGNLARFVTDGGFVTVARRTSADHPWHFTDTCHRPVTGCYFTLRKLIHEALNGGRYESA